MPTAAPNEDFGRRNKRCNPDFLPTLQQPSATIPLFLDNLHFEHFDKSVKHKSALKYLSKCSKWRLSKKRGLVADGCFAMVLSPNRVLTPLKSASFEIRISSFCSSSQNLRLGSIHNSIKLSYVFFCKSTPPKRRFWKDEQKMKSGFSSTFQGREYSIWATSRGKVLRKSGFHLLFLLPKSSFGEHKISKRLFRMSPNEDFRRSNKR